MGKKKNEPERLRPLRYDALMRLDEFEIEQLLPFGAIKEGEKWTSAIEGEKSDKTLKGLLRDRRRRREKPRYMVGQSPQRLRWDVKKKKWVPKEFSPNEEHGYTENPSRALDRSAPSVPGDVQERFVADARERFNMTLEVEEKAERILYLRRRLEKKSIRSVRKAA